MQVHIGYVKATNSWLSISNGTEKNPKQNKTKNKTKNKQTNKQTKTFIAVCPSSHLPVPNLLLPSLPVKTSINCKIGFSTSNSNSSPTRGLD